MLHDWTVRTTETYWVYPLPESTLDVNCLALVGNFDIGEIIGGLAVSNLSETEMILLKQFTTLVHENTFGTAFPSLNYNLFYCVVRNGFIAWDFLQSCCGIEHSDARGLDQSSCPCIVWSSTGQRFYRVESVIFKSPSKYMIHMDRWGEQKVEPSSVEVRTLADYYYRKYGIAVDSAQNVLAARLGSPIVPAPLSAHVKMLPKKKLNPESSTVYLIPQLVAVHALTQIQQELSLLPRYLFWIESGIVAREILFNLVGTSPNATFVEWGEMFVPPGIRCYNSMPVMLMHIALTCPSAQLQYSYDKLEWLGDAVWRFAASLAGLENFKIRFHFNVILSNERMGTVCAEIFPLLANSSILSNPPSLKAPQVARCRLRNLNILADVIEAVVAVSFILGGLSSVSKTLENLGLLTVNDLASPATETHSVESFFNSAVKIGFASLRISLKLLREFPNDTVGELTEKRRIAIKKTTHTISYTQMPTNWDHALV